MVKNQEPDICFSKQCSRGSHFHPGPAVRDEDSSEALWFGEIFWGLSWPKVRCSATEGTLPRIYCSQYLCWPTASYMSYTLNPQASMDSRYRHSSHTLKWSAYSYSTYLETSGPFPGHLLKNISTQQHTAYRLRQTIEHTSTSLMVFIPSGFGL